MGQITGLRSLVNGSAIVRTSSGRGTAIGLDDFMDS
jgi:hypothetical protein